MKNLFITQIKLRMMEIVKHKKHADKSNIIHVI